MIIVAEGAWCNGNTWVSKTHFCTLRTKRGVSFLLSDNSPHGFKCVSEEMDVDIIRDGNICVTKKP